MQKQTPSKVRELFDKARQWKARADKALSAVRYTSIPLWKPWRDYDFPAEDNCRSR
jgi:hypothetical protein